MATINATLYLTYLNLTDCVCQILAELNCTPFELNEGAGFNVPNGSQKGSVESSVKSSVKIIEMMKENPKITIPMIAESLRVTTRAVEKNIAKLQAEGIVKRVGPDKGGYWEVS